MVKPVYPPYNFVVGGIKIQKYGSNGTNKATTFDCP
jgi:hypothetical protein